MQSRRDRRGEFENVFRTNFCGFFSAYSAPLREIFLVFLRQGPKIDSQPFHPFA